MVLPAHTLKAISRYWNPENGGWCRVAQTLIGLFFVGAGIFKIYNYFLIGDGDMSQHFQYWIDYGWPPEWYQVLMRWGQQYPKQIAFGVIVCQIVPGLMYVLNYRVRLASFFLLALQVNVFLGTFNHTNFNEFVGTSVWIPLYYLLKPDDPKAIPRRLWTILTYLFIGVYLIQIKNRFNYNDPHTIGFAYQYEHLAGDVMSSSAHLKALVIHLGQYKWFQILWLSTWYIRMAMILGLMTRWRLQCGTVLLAMWIVAIPLWLNGLTSQGVLWSLITFIWVSQEHIVQYVDKKKAKGKLKHRWLTNMQRRLSLSQLSL